MSQPSTDRNLLFGILALQMDFIGKDALVKAMNAWILEKTRPLGAILVAQQVLSTERCALLEALVQEHVKQHGDDPHQSLAALSSAGSVRDDLRALADPDLHASLANVSSATDSNATASHSLGGGAPAGIRFRILRPHARGGLGEVFVAHDEELHREVALKEIQNKHADHPESRARFLQEAEITGRLEHPGIVPVYGLGSYDDGRPFYAMRFIKGDSLKDAIARFHQAEADGRDSGTRQVEFRKLLGRFVDVCNAIAYAHSRGILHRDLKPGNVMLGQYGETLVVDWGLAKPVGAAETATATAEEPLRPSLASRSAPTEMGRALGTPAYMSPEQAAGRLDQLGPASDVYSLGATLYCLLTGQAPFQKEEEGEDVLQRVQRGEVPPPRHLKPAVPPPLQAVCLKAMALRPEARYASVKALAEDVEHWLADEPISAWPEPWTVRARRWLGRHRTAMTATAAAAMVALVSLGVATVLLTAANEEERKARDLAQRKEKEAHENEIVAVAARKDLEKANDQLERALARSLLRPLGLYTRLNFGSRRGGLTDAETVALEELARTGSRRLARRFIKEGCREAVASRQLRERAEYALHAAIGLDLERRAEVEEVLRNRLEEQLPAPQARDLAQLTATLGDLTPETSVVVGRVLADAMRKLPQEEFRDVHLGVLAKHLQAVGGRLDQEGSRKVVEPLITAWLTAKAPETLQALVEVLNIVGGRLDPELAGKAVDALLTANLPSTGGELSRLLKALQAVGRRLRPEEASKAADVLLARMAKPSDPAVVGNLAEALGALGARLDAERGAKGVDILLALLVRTNHPYSHRHVTRGLRALHQWLDVGRTRRAVEAVLAAMTKAEDPNTVRDLAWSLRTVAGDLDAERGGKAVDALVGAMAQAKDPFILRGLAEHLQALSGGLNADRAGKAVEALVAAIARSPNHPDCHRFLAESQATVSGRLDTARAAMQASKTADLLLAAMRRTTNDGALINLALGVKAVIARLDPFRASLYAGKATEFLRGAIVRADDAYTQAFFAKALGALGPWLDAAQAGKAADVVLIAMDNTNKGFVNQENYAGFILDDMAEALDAIVAQVDAERTRKAADILLAGMRKAKDGKTVRSLAWRLKAIGKRLDAERAEAAVSALMVAIARTEDPSALDGLAQALGALGPQLDAERAGKAGDGLLAAFLRTYVVDDGSKYARLVNGLTAISWAFDPDRAAKIADGLVAGMAKLPWYWDKQNEAECFGAILSREHPKSISRRVRLVTAGVGGLGALGGTLTAPAVLHPAMKPVPPALPAQVLVKLLKHPLCVGPARRAVLDQLQRHYDRRFADQWDFVRFVRERQLPLDLTSPPQRQLPGAAPAP